MFSKNSATKGNETIRYKLKGKFRPSFVLFFAFCFLLLFRIKEM